MSLSNMKAIFAIVERGKAENIVDEAKKVGAKGATIVYGRGTGDKEFQKFFNLHIESSKEIIIIITDEDLAQPICQSMMETGKLDEPGTGIVFTVPIDDVLGLKHRQDINV